MWNVDRGQEFFIHPLLVAGSVACLGVVVKEVGGGDDLYRTCARPKAKRQCLISGNMMRKL
jgi:hypothetical protein